MSDETIRLLTLVSLIEGDGGIVRQTHGIEAIDSVIPAGRYHRRHPAGLDIVDLLPSQAIVTTYLATLAQDFGPFRRFVLRDALVTGQGAVITRGGALLDESCWEFLAHGHVPYGLIRQDGDTFDRIASPTAAIAAPSLLLKRPWWRNYGHWLVDAASLLALLVKHGVSGFDQVIIGTREDSGLAAIFRETLACVAPGLAVVEHPDDAMWSFAELHYFQPIRRPPLCTLPEAIEALRVAVLGDTPAPQAGRRLFVSRLPQERRRLDNEPAILEVCKRNGFEAVYTGALSLREQAALFRSASAIVGVKGAGLTNVIFAPSDATLIALSPGDFADPIFWDIAGARGLSYAEIFGGLVTDSHGQAQNPFTIDPARLDAMLRAVLPSATISVPTAPTRASADTVFPSLLPGEEYQACLARIHAKTKPRTYLEIGTLNGRTLALSRCRSIAIDPEFQITETLPGAMPSLFLFQGESDAFFAAHDPRTMLGAPIDLALIDGMHWFEYALRDFINLERHCHRGSMIILHDCIPMDFEMTGRSAEDVLARSNSRFPGWWTGDVWKVADILLRYRPDLDVIALDAPPTGLILVRGLDPNSTVLRSGYDAIVQSYNASPDLPALAAYFRRLNVYTTAIVDWFDTFETAAGR